MAKSSVQTAPLPSSEVDSSSEGSSASDEEQPASTKSMPKPAPPTPTKNKEEAESDDESEDESEDERSEESTDDEDDEDEEEGKEDSKKPQPSVSTPSTKPASESVESGSESDDEESDSDSEAAKLVTPISSKPMAEVSVKKEKAKPTAEVTLKEEKANGKGTFFQRIWTLEDEIAMLRGLVTFQAEKGPVKLKIGSIRDFYDIIKDKLTLEVTSSQLFEKLRRLKKKYLGIAAREAHGKPHQSTAHDEAVYELGKNIWADEDESDVRVSNGVEVKNGGGSLKEKVGNLKDKFPFLKGAVESMGKRYAEEALEMLDVAKADALDKKLKKQKMAEMKHTMHDAELWKETLKLIMEGIERATS